MIRIRCFFHRPTEDWLLNGRKKPPKNQTHGQKCYNQIGVAGKCKADKEAEANGISKFHFAAILETVDHTHQKIQGNGKKETRRDDFFVRMRPINHR